MDIIRGTASGRSIRKYRRDPVPGEQILTIPEAGRLAPSGSNECCFHITFERRCSGPRAAGYRETVPETIGDVIRMRKAL